VKTIKAWVDSRLVELDNGDLEEQVYNVDSREWDMIKHWDLVELKIDKLFLELSQNKPRIIRCTVIVEVQRKVIRQVGKQCQKYL